MFYSCVHTSVYRSERIIEQDGRLFFDHIFILYKRSSDECCIDKSLFFLHQFIVISSFGKMCIIEEVCFCYVFSFDSSFSLYNQRNHDERTIISLFLFNL
jgi:hypothetical protein